MAIQEFSSLNGYGVKDPTARSAASEAKSTATTAQGTANEAKQAAATADGKAVEAQEKANEAYDLAIQGKNAQLKETYDATTETLTLEVQN